MRIPKLLGLWLVRKHCDHSLGFHRNRGFLVWGRAAILFRCGVDVRNLLGKVLSSPGHTVLEVIKGDHQSVENSAARGRRGNCRVWISGPCCAR